MTSGITKNQEIKLNTAAGVLGEDPEWLTTLYALNIISIKETLKEYDYVESLSPFKVLAGIELDQNSGLSISEILTPDNYLSHSNLLFPVSLTSKESLSKQEIFYLSNHPVSSKSLATAIELFINDLGFECAESDTFVKAVDYADKLDTWAFEKTALDEVISKVLLSLIHQGYRTKAENLFGELEAIIEQYREKGVEKLLNTWRNNVYAENSLTLKE